MIFIFEPHLAGGAQVALDAYSQLPLNLRAQLQRNQMQRVLMHRAAFYSIHRSFIRPRILLQPPLQQGNQRRLAPADRSHQQQYPFAHIQTPGGGMEILLHQLFYGTVESKNLLLKKLIPFTPVDVLYAV
ncbi:hypothetical protein D3C73_727450 [compost metagenome]